MTLNEKRTLVRLLNEYQDERIGIQMENIEEIKNAEAQGKSKWQANIKFGCKAEYEHARILSTKISKEINEELPSCWEL